MVTAENYFSVVARLSVDALPETLRKGHDLVVKTTDNGNAWENYSKNENIKRVIDKYLEKFNEYVSKTPVKTDQPEKPEPEVKAEKQAAPVVKKPVVRRTPAVAPARKVVATKPKQKAKADEIPAKLVEHWEEDVKLIRSFISLHNKKVKPKSILNLLARLQKAISQKLISRKSTYASEIKTIQDKLVKVANDIVTSNINRDTPLLFEIENKKLLNSLSSIAGGEKIYPSVAYIKRFIGMQGKELDRKKAESFVSLMEKAIKSGRIGKKDPYIGKVRSNIRILKSHLDENQPVLRISKTELNGLMGILADCGCHGLDGLENTPEAAPSGIMNSMDFVQLEFEGLGFTGKWLNLIGDPARGFSAMVFGKPKFGKSYLCIDFAGYLARNFGPVLYVAKEEELDATLQKKLKDKSVAHPNLFVSDYLPDDLSPYQFVFLDSVTKLGMEPEDLNKLEKQYPGISFIYVFQVRKDGKFRGRNDFQHDVDVVIEVPEKGLAVQYGRFNQGGQMQIFEDGEFQE